MVPEEAEARVPPLSVTGPAPVADPPELAATRVPAETVVPPE